jgi:hypothetical protein
LDSRAALLAAAIESFHNAEVPRCACTGRGRLSLSKSNTARFGRTTERHQLFTARGEAVDELRAAVENDLDTLGRIQGANMSRDKPVRSVDEPGAKRQRRCSKCRKTGHRITKCPESVVNESEDDESRPVASSVSHDDENLGAVDEEYDA